MAVSESPRRPDTRDDGPGAPDTDAGGAGTRAAVRLPTRTRKLTSQERNRLTSASLATEDRLPALEPDLPSTAAVPLVAPAPAEPVTVEPVTVEPEPVPLVLPGGPLAPPPAGPPAPAPAGGLVRTTLPALRTRRMARPRVRKVTRVVRYVDAWSVFKIALLVNVMLAVVFLTASVLLWNLANTTDVVDNIEGVIADWFAYETFALDGPALFRTVQVLSLLFVVAATGLAVLAAVLFNLISDLTGGVRFTVLEQEVVARRRSEVPPPGSGDVPPPGPVLPQMARRPRG